jgi:outer membrane protein assembly factor BamA
LGLILRYDSRDIPVNAWGGSYVDLQATAYNASLGGDNLYQIYLVDARQYFNLGREGKTFAMQLKTRLGFGDIPYGELSQLGTPFD